ncbi:MAG: N-methyl-L-tryptophan oxidase [Chloroflexota bacterium]|nr:N-methyl-L-tryptophan oxidase [Chloroflexota bacterium]
MIYDAVIVGAGIMGLSTAHSLLKRGLRHVIVLEAAQVGHDRASSTDATKAIRYEYGESEIYSRMVDRSIRLWRELEVATGKELYVNCGVVTWGRADAPYARSSFNTVSRLGIPIREVSPDELCRLYPQFSRADITYATVSRFGGFLRASRCVQGTAQCVTSLGGEIREQADVMQLSEIADVVDIVLADGERIQSRRAVLVAGAWNARLLPTLGVTIPLTANKQQVVYVAGLGEEFAPGPFPVFLNLDHDFYGFPLDENGLFKTSLHLPGPIVDPTKKEPPSVEFEQTIVSLLNKYIPGAARGRVSLSRVCMYAMTPDEDFILDRLPGFSNVVLGAGFSGHGFKFGPLIGEMLSARLMEEEPVFSLEPFRIDRFAQL